MSNKLTPEEKQMPVIRIPLRIAVFAWMDLFITSLACIMLWTADNFAEVFAVGFMLGIPALIGIVLYSNHRICFDKNYIVYRDFKRKITRFRYEDITEIIETEHKTFLVEIGRAHV